MKNVVALAVLLALVAVPAFAEEVPQATLSALGLGDMQVVSDAQGMQVRGMASSFGMVRGTSLIFGQLVTADTLNFATFSSVSSVDANADNAAVTGLLTVAKTHSIEVDPPVTLDVTFPDLTSFTGSISGLITGSGEVGLLQP